ncbi:hypothetical protein [Saccharopolyspora sp. NPDC049426]|uniref:hypothetical protein n=1 Tax=Saccharopolyspora sp. NPDC049426 TaxID=3155652 RepID=UPI00344951BF
MSHNARFGAPASRAAASRRTTIDAQTAAPPRAGEPGTSSGEGPATPLNDALEAWRAESRGLPPAPPGKTE